MKVPRIYRQHFPEFSPRGTMKMIASSGCNSDGRSRDGADYFVSLRRMAGTRVLRTNPARRGRLIDFGRSRVGRLNHVVLNLTPKEWRGSATRWHKGTGRRRIKRHQSQTPIRDHRTAQDVQPPTASWYWSPELNTVVVGTG